MNCETCDGSLEWFGCIECGRQFLACLNCDHGTDCTRCESNNTYRKSS